MGRFAQADSIIAGGIQGLDRYAYANNNPLKYTDPSGHRPDDGCSTLGCSLSQKQKDNDARRLAELEKEQDERKCQAGNKNYCPTVETHPGEVAGFVVTGLVGGPLVEDFILGGGAADVADAALWGLQKASWKAGWRVLQVCAAISACRELAIKIGIYYPTTNQGFATVPTPITLQEGQLITRMGDAEGVYASPIGTTLSQRALPFHQWNAPLTGYQVLKPIDVLSGPAASYYGLPGGGTQYLFSQPLQYYIDNGYLSEPWP